MCDKNGDKKNFVSIMEMFFIICNIVEDRDIKIELLTQPRQDEKNNLFPKTACI